MVEGEYLLFVTRGVEGMYLLFVVRGSHRYEGLHWHHEGYGGKYQNLRVKLDGGRLEYPDQSKLLIGVGMVAVNDEGQGDFVAPWAGYTDETETLLLVNIWYD